ncbi:hypothetical protein ACF1DV_07965 [Streptomyces achromogenes]|uniref:hypothetical protein n=1 Tax=Streptomyces achromogenes TaxID=67255 RepID=UPI0036FE2A69
MDKKPLQNAGFLRTRVPRAAIRQTGSHHGDQDMAALLAFQSWFNSLGSRVGPPEATPFIGDDVELWWIDSDLCVEGGAEQVRALLVGATPEHHLSLYATERREGRLFGLFRPATFGGETELHVITENGRVIRIVVAISPERGWVTRLTRSRSWK